MRLKRWHLILIVAALAVGALLATTPVQYLILAVQYENELVDSTPTDTTEKR